MIINPRITRKYGLALLGEGCKDCKLRERCFMDKCNLTPRYRLDGMSEFGSEYMHCNNVGLEVYARQYKNTSYLIVKGEKYKSGEDDDKWRMHVYDKNREWIASVEFGDEEVKDGYIRRKYLKHHYGVPDKFPLKNNCPFIS